MSDNGYWRYLYTAGQPVLCLSIVSYKDGVHASLISITHILCTCMSWGGGGGGGQKCHKWYM